MRSALLLSVNLDTTEIVSLLSTIDISVADCVIQKRSEPHAKTFLGPGKIDEVAERAKEMDFEYVVVNGVLKPSQHHSIEMKFGRQCMDRVGVILRIFAEHAHTEEAKKQVTLATLRYELPFLREWIHKAKAGERPGFLSGGAYATEVYYEHARSHIKRIEEDITRRASQRDLMRRRRRDRGYFLASVAGYTNAGKSALINALCDSEVQVDDKLFATLSTTTRKLKKSKQNILITDTVGFISDLPAGLVHAFRSTFEEVFLADVVLLAIDVSEPKEMIVKKVRVCLEEISSQIGQRPLILVGTKADLLNGNMIRHAEEILYELAEERDVVVTSSIDGFGMKQLVNLIESKKRSDCSIRAILPSGGETEALISEFYDTADLRNVYHGETETEIVISCSSGDVERLQGRLKKAGARLLSDART